MNQFLFLDCDSTLCAIEGVDELAALRGPEVEKQVIALTNQAMDGSIPINDVFGRRLDLIQPTREMCEQVGQMYIERLSPQADKIIAQLQKQSWEVIIISGGFTQVIEPLAAKLKIQTIFAVDLKFNKDGTYQGFEQKAPTARNGGKPDIIENFLRNKPSSKTVMMGDGVSDLETKTIVDLFIGYGGIITRQAVKTDAKAFINNFEELPKTIKTHL